MHLNEFPKALARMADAIRPGGWMIIEELDYVSKAIVNHLHDSALRRQHEEGKRMLDSLQKQGVIDVYFGRRVRSLVEELGYVYIGHEGNVPVYRGGETMALFDKMTGSAANRNVNVVSTNEIDDVAEVFTDPLNYWVGPTFFSAWGRKPK